MELPLSPGTRRTEDIALDLLKFVAGHANLGRQTSAPGFGPPAAARPEDQVSGLLALYERCRAAVESPLSSQAGYPAAK